MGGSSTTSPPRVRFPLWAKLVLLSSAVAVLPLAVAAWRLLDVNGEALRASSREYQLAVTEDMARVIDDEMIAAQDGLDGVGQALTRGDLDERVRVAMALAMVAAIESLDHVSIYDANGELIDTIQERGQTLPPAPPRLEPALLDAARTRGLATGPVISFGGTIRAGLAVPMRADGLVTGFAASQVSLVRIQTRVETLARERFGELADALFVVDPQGRVIAHPDREQALHLRVASDREGPLAVRETALTHDLSQTSEFRDSHGTAMIGTLTPLPARGWVVIAQVPQRVAYASLARTRRLILITLGAALVLAVIAAVLLGRATTRPVRRLTAFAADLAARRFSRRVEVRSRDELAVLASTMNQAAADLDASEQVIAHERAIRADLGRYLSAPLVEAVVRRTQDMRLGGERRRITVLFADVCGFTPLSERLPPEDIVAILNHLFSILTEIVFRHGGTVDKFIGDCVMAFWGAPIARDDDAARAIAAAEDMVRWLEIGNESWRARYGVTLELAIGLHTGDAIVGNVGSSTRMEYTAIGDTVNIAARLEGIARPMQIVVSEATRAAAGDGFDTVDLGARALPGRVEPITVHEVRP